jgi:hypothetical protein
MPMRLQRSRHRNSASVHLTIGCSTLCSKLCAIAFLRQILENEITCAAPGCCQLTNNAVAERPGVPTVSTNTLYNRDESFSIPQI